MQNPKKFEEPQIYVDKPQKCGYSLYAFKVSNFFKKKLFLPSFFEFFVQPLVDQAPDGRDDGGLEQEEKEGADSKGDVKHCVPGEVPWPAHFVQYKGDDDEFNQHHQ